MTDRGRAETGGREGIADRFWVPSNILSLLRLPLAGATLYYIRLGPEFRVQLFVVIAAAVISDIVDGAVARRRGEVTRWGKILDPLADKVAIGSVTVALVLFRDLPVWVAVAVLGRDVLIVLAGIFLVRRAHVVVSSNVWGKLTSVVMSAVIGAYAMDVAPLKQPLLVAAAALLLASSVSYGSQFVKFLRSART